MAWAKGRQIGARNGPAQNQLTPTACTCRHALSVHGHKGGRCYWCQCERYERMAQS